MATSAERLFERLKSKKALASLIGEPEDADFDCKDWPPKSEGARAMVAKAASGFANATGGVIVIGMTAKSPGSGMPDVVQGLAAVTDRKYVASQALDFILASVEPGIEGIQTRTIPETPGAKSGFVLIFVPAMQGSPCRSKADWKFYVRIASGTLPMEYFQIEDRFGRRPHPKLLLELREAGVKAPPIVSSYLYRTFKVSIRNEGRGIARFPCFRLKKAAKLSFDNNPYSGDQPIWTIFDRGDEWLSIRGNSNDVIYPGELIEVATLIQNGTRIGTPKPGVLHMQAASYTWKYPATAIETEVLCDGMVPECQSFRIEAFTYQP